LDPNLYESANTVGSYTLVKKLPSVNGIVVQASSADNRKLAIKVYEKSNVRTPSMLESIYRHYRFTSELLVHANIPRCEEMLHSQRRLYMVLAFAGPQNLAVALHNRPGQRFDSDEALDCFNQIADAIAYIHSRDMSHRALEPRHVAIKPKESGGYSCGIVDFSHAVVVKKGAAPSRTVCGTLPCMAPEIALDVGYIPFLADRWSVGAILLEMGGGLQSMSRSVPFDPDATPTSAAPAIIDYFAQPGSQARALALQGAVNNPAILTRLTALLQSTPEDRCPLIDFVQ